MSKRFIAPLVHCLLEVNSATFSLILKVLCLYCVNIVFRVASQTSIGNVDVQSSPVIFYVQKSQSFSAQQTAIPFDIEVINIGNAMDITSGVFTAPKNGIYFFSLSGLANMNNGLFYVTLAKNGQPVGRSSVVLPVAAVS